jgi:hypothetical protein
MEWKLDLGHAGQIGFEHIAAQAVGDELAVTAGFDEAGGLKFLHVMGDGGGADFSASTQLLTGERVACLADAAQQVVAARVGERACNQMKAGVGKSGHGHLFMLKPFLIRLDSHRLESAEWSVKDGPWRAAT